jgi:hypothetical protein
MNIPSYGSVTLTELIWMVSATPGFLLWAANLQSAWKDLRAVRRLGIIDGRLVWARFAVLKNTAFMLVEASFILIGVTAMLQAPVSGAGTRLTPTGLVLTLCLLSTSVLMTIVGLRWRQVAKYIIDAARLRTATDRKPVE